MMNIILVGFMGSGKSSTAWTIHKRIGLRYVDTDRIIEKQEKMNITEIFSKKGEAYFRQAEVRVVKDYLLFCNECVIATGGGLPCHHNHMEILKNIGWVFHLNISFEEIVKRAINKTHRPLFADEEKARELYTLRRECYSKAHFEVDANRPTDEIVKQILSALPIFYC